MRVGSGGGGELGRGGGGGIVVGCLITHIIRVEKAYVKVTIPMYTTSSTSWCEQPFLTFLFFTKAETSEDCKSIVLMVGYT